MKTNFNTVSEIISHYDGSLEQTLLLLNVIKQMSENTQLHFMHLILSVCQFAMVVDTVSILMNRIDEIAIAFQGFH